MNLGYLEPKSKLRWVPDYVFIPPPVSQNNAATYVRSLDKHISGAKAAGSKFAKPKRGAQTPPLLPSGSNWLPLVAAGFFTVMWPVN